MNYFEQNNRATQWIAHGIIVFWALWSLLVALSDSINLFQQLNLLPGSWAFTSKNYDLVVQLFSYYQVNHQTLHLIMYCLIVLLAWVIAIVSARAALTKPQSEHYLPKCYTAFLFIFAIDALFILVDEIFIQFALEHGHMDRLGFKLISFLVFIAAVKIYSTNSEL